ncbi:hypothetical protein DEU56DRAFT_822697 [Suillus clintonianus]|uniref:uncharacterized protein n=1 Tax=Suillus clintonianus TaxID=1904413 RepID=UPI001B864825|nr:uncharacterized protein DEU56DRAFT_822697 [Suillus clintonianus]KAG2126302.1 hypothetical protein DEU56DRAFT_822697 [Suillus clintonianus]
MPKNNAASPASPSPLDRSSSRSAAGHLPPRPSRSLVKKSASRAEGVVCKKRKRSTEVREYKVSNDGDRMCLAQRLRHDDGDDDAFITDRHARSGLRRAPSYRKERLRSGSPAHNPYKDSNGTSLQHLKSSDRRTSDDKGKEKTSSLPSLNNRGSGSVNALHDTQHPASQDVPSVDSVDKFLDSIDLSIAPSYGNPALAKSKVPATPIQQVLPPTPVSIAPMPLPLPESPPVELRPIPFTFGPEQLSLSHHGHSLNYDLNLLPDDPVGPITLLGTTQSEPGAYLVAAAHYRRTGRSRAACKVSPSLAKSLAPSVFTPIDVNTPAHEAAVLRPAILFLAACQLDISRDSSSPEEKIAHANAAQELFRTVYGTKNNILPPESGNTNTDANALGLAFTDRARIPSTANNKLPNSMSKQTSGVPTAPASTRILALEDELRLTRTAKSILEADLTAAKKHQQRSDQSAREAETRSRDALRLLETERDEFRVLKRRLVETEQKVSDMEQSAAGAENRVWVRLRDMFYDQFGNAF